MLAANEHQPNTSPLPIPTHLKEKMHRILENNFSLGDLRDLELLISSYRREKIIKSYSNKVDKLLNALRQEGIIQINDNDSIKSVEEVDYHILIKALRVSGAEVRPNSLSVISSIPYYWLNSIKLSIGVHESGNIFIKKIFVPFCNKNASQPKFELFIASRRTLIQDDGIYIHL